MIQPFVDRFMANRDSLAAKFAEHPSDYSAVVRAVIEVVSDENEYDDPDPERIHEIDDGRYQGTLLFVIGAKGYQPNDYWYVKVGYGSCSVCDTLEAIRGYSDEPPSEEQVKDYLGLALNVVQGLRKMEDGYGV